MLLIQILMVPPFPVTATITRHHHCRTVDSPGILSNPYFHDSSLESVEGAPIQTTSTPAHSAFSWLKALLLTPSVLSGGSRYAHQPTNTTNYV